jgi:O-antigen/teichoic acid export membrane protein
MIVGIVFAANALFNFLVGLLVAKFLGPAEFGRFAIATASAVIINTAGFDWIRLSAVRFYSRRTRIERPQVRMALDACIGSGVAAVSLVVAILAFSGLDLPLTPGLIVMAGLGGVASGFYDYRTALARARFLDGVYVRIILAKNVLGMVFIVGGAWWTQSAIVALAGLVLSVAGALSATWRSLSDERGDGAGRMALARSFAAYGVPLIAGSVLFQLIPLGNRALVSALYGFDETGQFSLANDIGVRIFAAIAAAMDVLLFQLAVRADETHGADAARAQLASNMTIQLAILAPLAAGVWLTLPSFEALIVPQAFRGPFAVYFTAMLPGLLAWGLMSYSIAPIFQIAKRTRPMIVAALAACLADAVMILFSPRGADALWLALAQSISSIVGLGVAFAFALTTAPRWPRLRDIAASGFATGVMVVALLPLRGAPGLTTLIEQTLLGLGIYGGLALLFDLGGLRALLGRRAAYD